MTPLVELTPRERQVYALLKEGRSDKDIATQLGVALNTAKCHVRNVRRRLNARVGSRVASRRNPLEEIHRLVARYTIQEPA